MVDLTINPDLDVAALAKAFAKSKRVQVRDFLTPESADALYDQIINRTIWNWAYREDDEVRFLSGKIHKEFPQDKQKAIWRKAYLRAQNDQQFVHFHFDIEKEREEAPDPENPLFTMPEFLASEAVIGAVQAIIGQDGITAGKADAVWFSRDQFLTARDGTGDNETAIFFIDLVKDWQPDYGGMLQFFDDEQNVEEGILPRYNSLSLLAVPQRHAISYVTPFMDNFRVGITGCFKNGGSQS